MKGKRPLQFIWVFSFLIGGCAATWHHHDIQIHPPQRIRIAVLPVGISVKIKRLKSVHSVGIPPQSVVEEKALIDKEMKNVAEETTKLMEDRLRSSYFFEVVPHEEVRRALEKLKIPLQGDHWTPEQIQSAGKKLHVSMMLTTKLSGYGKVKKKWLFYLIGAGVVEGTVEGVVGAVASSNPWVGAGLAAEEVLQEAVTWGGGAWVFNRLFTPVILEGKLFSTSDGRVIWKKSVLAKGNYKALKDYSKEDRKKKEIRLHVTTEKAVANLINGLLKVTWRNIRAPAFAQPRTMADFPLSKNQPLLLGALSHNLRIYSSTP